MDSNYSADKRYMMTFDPATRIMRHVPHDTLTPELVTWEQVRGCIDAGWTLGNGTVPAAKQWLYFDANTRHMYPAAANALTPELVTWDRIRGCIDNGWTLA